MRFDITFDKLLGGFVENSGRAGDQVLISCRDFVSSEDGDKLVRILESLSESVLSYLPVIVKPSTIDHLLVIIRPDNKVTVYINELQLLSTVKPRRPLKVGEPVFERDILDVQRMQILNMTIPPDAGFMILVSCGWRKGFYYDLAPLGPEKSPRNYEIELLLAQVWSYLTFQALFRIEEQTWRELFRQRWFPFISLGQPLLKEMVEHARHGWDIDGLLPKIRKEVDRTLIDAAGVWQENPYFEPHLSLLQKAIERYQSDDHVSAAAILYPRIEGVMRSYFTSAGIQKRLNAPNLVDEVVKRGSEQRNPCCLFLPDKFHLYLDEVYFAKFTPGAHPPVGRHSLAHGEARADDFGLKSSIIGLMTLYQIALFLSAEPPTRDKTQEDEVEAAFDGAS